MPLMQGKFQPKHPEKYAGDSENITYRSSWELRFMSHLDKNPDVIMWASEELVIPYYDPTTKRFRRYFPDFVVKVRTKEGNIKTTVFEIKPSSQAKEPDLSKVKSKRKAINEIKTWGVNQAKWEAAQLFCEERNWTFQVLTEKELFGKRP